MTTPGGCPNCGAPVGDTDFACRQCGRSFVGDPAAVAASISQAPRPAPPPQNAYAPNPYAAPSAPYMPGYAPGYPSSQSTRDSAQASTALYMAIGGIFCFGFALGFGAIRVALLARSEIAKNPGMTGSGKATAAILLGALDILGWVVFMARRFHH